MASVKAASTPPSVATPRKSNLSVSHYGADGCKTSEEDAPLGFEPEGSASSTTPPFTEASGTPPFYKWAENICYLLEDVDGVDLFSRFLEHENILDVLPFYFAVKGLRDQQLQSKPDKIQQLIKLIFKKYLRGDRVILVLKEGTKKSIQEKMLNKKEGNQLEPGIFDAAQQEVLDYLAGAPYAAFLKSDLYVQHIQCGGPESLPGESVESSGSSSGAGSHAGTRPVSQGYLPTLHENEELELSDALPSGSARDDFVPAAAATASAPSARSSGAGPSPNVVPLSLKTLMATRHSRSATAGEYPTTGRGRNIDHQGRSINPYHMNYCTSYNPVSAQDSELQSLSSDALTDTDTKSLTDSSVDRYPLNDRFRKRQAKQENRAIRRSADQNPDELVTHHRFIPRTERLPKDVKPLAESDCELFARDLTQRLEKVLEKQMKEEKLQESLRLLSVNENQEQHSKQPVEEHPAPPPVPRKTGVPSAPPGPGVANSLKGLIFTTLLAPRGEGGGVDDEAQAILDEHVSKWDRSGHHTPSRTRSPPNGRKGAQAGAAFNAPPRHRRHKGGAMSSSSFDAGSTDTASLVSKDSGVSRDYLIQYQGQNKDHGVDVGKTGFHHLHPGHPLAFYKNPSGQGLEKIDARNVAAFRSHDPNAGQIPGGPAPTSASTFARSKSRMTVHSTDAGSSCVDSGVSGVYVGGASATSASEGQAKPLPFSEKVIAWMQDNENFSDLKKSGSSYEASEGRSSSARNRSDRGNGDRASVSHKSMSGGQGSQSPALHRTDSWNGWSVGMMGGWPNKRAVAAVAPTMPAVGVGSGANHPTSYHHFGPPGTPLASNSVWPVIPNAAEMHRSGSGVGTRQGSGAASLISEKPSKKSPSSAGASLPMSAGAHHGVHPGVAQHLGVHPGSNNPSLTNSLSGPGAFTGSSTSSDVGGSQSSSTICGYYFCGEPIPYRVSIPSKNPTLAQFKALLTKRGNFRFFFKKSSDEFDSGVVFTEVSDDSSPLPFWEGKIVGKVERLD